VLAVLLTCAGLLAVGMGAFSQRLSGMGFSLLTAPLLVLLHGPRDGVALTNLLSIVVALAVFAGSARRVDTGKLAVLLPVGLLGVLPGVLVVRAVPAGPLQVCVGAATILGLAAVAAPRLRIRAHPAATASAGFASGFSSAVAGAGGPPLALYSVATRWPQPEFAATSQLCFASQAAASLAFKGLSGLSAASLGASVAAAVVGLLAGAVLAGRVSSTRTRQAAMIIAALASAVAIVDGLLR
jgi:Sulfite exporter TauE/SafE.